MSKASKPKECSESEKREPRRVNLQLNTRAGRHLDELSEMTDADSITEVIRRSLAVHHFIQKAMTKGSSIVIRTKDGEEKDLILL